MAKKLVLVSDLTGREIPTNDGAKVRISYEDGRRGVVELDVIASEVEDWAKRGRKQQRRGRRPTGQTADSPAEARTS